MASPVRTARRLPPGPTIDLAQATVLFRRLLGCTLAVFFAGLGFGLLEERLNPGLRLLGTLFVGFGVLLPLLVVAVVAATRLARELGRPTPWRFGLAAALPCPNLIAVTWLGSYLVPAWAAARESPLLLLQPRAVIERRAGGRSTLPGFSVVGFLATLIFLLVCVWGMGSVLRLAMPETPSLRFGEGTARLGPTPTPSATTDTRFYGAYAGQGRPAFAAADARLTLADSGTFALGNTAEAAAAARRLGERMLLEIGRSLDNVPQLRPFVEANRPFRVYLEARPDRAVVLIQVPGGERFDGRTRRILLDLGWRAAREPLRELHLVGTRRVALALRGGTEYSAATWGELNDYQQRPVSLGSPADTTVLLAFFADARLPVPVPEASPGSAAARLREQRRQAPLLSTAEWKAFAGATSWDAAVRERGEAIQQYLTAADVEDLLRAAETAALPVGEIRTALSLLGRLAEGYDSRIDAAQENRLTAVLRRECLPVAPGKEALACSGELERLWGRMDRAFLETTFEQRLESTGRRDPLWSVLIETRHRASTPRWPGILEKLVRTELRQGRAAGDAFDYWLEADPAGAERAALALAPRTLTPEGRSWLAGALLAAATARDRQQDAGVRLAEIVALGGPAGRQARVAREILGLDPQDRIEALARRWRETRSTKALSELYYTYVEELPVGTPFARWRARLGVDASAGSSFHVTATDSEASLYLETDREGRLRAMSFD